MKEATKETKMERNAFDDEILQRLSETAEPDCSASIHQVDKNNGQKRAGIVIRAEGNRLSPVFYLDVMYDQYLRGVSLDELVKGVWQFWQEEAGNRQFDVDDFLDWTRVKSRLFLRVVSTDMNRETLETAVHKEILDLSVMVYARLDHPNDDGVASVVVRKDHLAVWNQQEEDVYALALQNTRQEDISFASITNVISELLSGEERELLLDDVLLSMESPLSVLTNKAMLFGAVCMVLPEVMEKIADEKEGDIYILPSSVHEILILKADGTDFLPQLQHMVQEINEMQVPVEQRLSNHVYRYSKEDGLSIAA